MVDNTFNNKRIARNTIFLYARMFITLIVGLYTSRVVLATLGFSDYGLYNVVGGVVAMFGFLNTTLSSSTQRYLNFELGQGNTERLKDVFSTALVQHILLIGVIIFLAETVGLWFVLNKLNVPEGREQAAMWCYQSSIIAVCVQIIQLPFMSSIIAHEKMDVYAYVSIFDVVAKLLVVYLIQIASFDRLIFYAALLLLVQIIGALIYDIYGHRHYSEVRFNLKYDKSLFKEMLGFSGWNVIGCLASALNNYGLNILFNLFFGTIVNAARGISFQVNGVVTQFSNNFQIAVKPQVVKCYACNQLAEMKRLVFNSAKYSAILMLLVVIPISLEIQFLLGIWLGEFPYETIAFVRIILVHSVFTAMLGPVLMAVHASGYLKNIAITAGLFNLLLLPTNYILLKRGLPPEAALFINIIGTCIETFIELFWLNRYIKFPILEFYKEVYLKVFVFAILMVAVPLVIHLFVPFGSQILQFFIVSSISVIISLLVLYKWGISKDLQSKIKLKIQNLRNRK